MSIENNSDVIAYLFDQYKNAVDKHEKPIYKKTLVDGATQFIEFAREFLNANRAVRTFIVDNNVGIVLANGAKIAVSPGSTSEDLNIVGGDMAPVAGAPRVAAVPGVPPSEALYMSQGAVPISGFARPPKTAVNYDQKGSGSVDKTADAPGINYGSKVPVAKDPFNR